MLLIGLESVSGAGDINGDGVDDLIIGAYVADPNGNSAAGESYVVFGGSGWAVRVDQSIGSEWHRRLCAQRCGCW